MDASLRKENLMNFTRSSPSNRGEAVLNLVFQAAEHFSAMEELVRETEARAQSICKSAVERAQIAEKRLEVAENARREVINEAERKLQDASNALITAEARIAAAEDKVTAFEFRAQSVEAQLQEAKQALLQVEEAIRERLLNDKKYNVSRQIAKELALL